MFHTSVKILLAGAIAALVASSPANAQDKLKIGFITTLAQPEGRIHFAGEHTSAWTGWMQGALESARRTVREINGTSLLP